MALLPRVHLPRLALTLALLAVPLSWLRWQPRDQLTLSWTVEVEPARLWTYLADFRRAAALSPAIEDLEMTPVDMTDATAPGAEDWSYTATYLERMETLPLFVGTAVSRYRVRRLGSRLWIEGQHRFCYLCGMLCSDASNELEFLPTAEDPQQTQLVENISYDCPLGLSAVCRSETEAGRGKFVASLRRALAAEETRAL